MALDKSSSAYHTTLELFENLLETLCNIGLRIDFVECKDTGMTSRKDVDTRYRFKYYNNNGTEYIEATLSYIGQTATDSCMLASLTVSFDDACEVAKQVF